MNLKKYWLLDEKNIDDVANEKPGVYVLGNNLSAFGLIVKYVGRSDESLNKRLRDWIGHYKYFTGEYADNGVDAYKKECKYFHLYGGFEKLDNEVHPDKPEGYNIGCPICGK